MLSLIQKALLFSPRLKSMLGVIYFAEGDEKEEVRLLQTPGTSSGTKLPFLGCATQAGNHSLASDAERPTLLFMTSAHFQV